MQEIWKDIKDFEGLYQVSNLGRVKSLPRFINNNSKNNKIGFYSKERILKPSKKKYAIVVLSKNGKTYSFYIHILVAKAFLPNPDNLPEVDHLDGNKLNNHVDNLEWVTSKENVKRSWRMGLAKPHSGRKKYVNK